MLPVLLISLNYLRKRVRKAANFQERRRTDVFVIDEDAWSGMLMASQFVDEKVWLKMEPKGVIGIFVFAAQQKLLASQKGTIIVHLGASGAAKQGLPSFDHCIRSAAGHALAEGFETILLVAILDAQMAPYFSCLSYTT